MSYLNEYGEPMALTSIGIKCFEQIVKAPNPSSLPFKLVPLQVARWPNRSTDNATAFAQNTALSHLDQWNTCVRMLFIRYITDFKTVVLSRLVMKLQHLRISSFLCS